MKRNPRKLKWTKAFRKAAGKEMTVDSTLTFAARRNVPIRYNRETVETTVKAMERVSEIKARRERVFYKKRMEGNKERQRELDRKLVAENEHLLPRVRASERMVVEEVKGIELPAERERVATKMKQKMRVDGKIEDAMDVN
ncbi:ATPase-activating ribosome biosynthesis protein [Puttea exsequens]|nr:ATPase-activating ribosome biosynthesis protein [Puttea exsequens]